jgi:alpha,alpha-trehalase
VAWLPFCLLALAPEVQAQDPAAELPAPARIEAVRAYIRDAWKTLTRSLDDLPAAAVDPKLHLPPGRPYPVYLARSAPRARLERELRQHLGPAFGRIELRVLPRDWRRIDSHGLLYLPHPYVVPGGRFNEMYGWDSYFIQVGLLRDGEVRRAKDLADNFVYQIEHYGTLLNANRSYYLSRSQPPFLTAMLLGVYERTGDRRWLRASLPAVLAYHRFWTRAPHVVPGLALSRYHDLGNGPAPEVVADEKDDQGRTHYDRVREYYKTQEVPDYDVARYYDRRRDALTELFYTGDRSMRESGFDPSNRFGPFNTDIIHYAPVCLNALLYRMELEIAEIYTLLGERGHAPAWRARAARRRAAIDERLWDPQAGLYFDYQFETHKRRAYEFATTFYPLWVGAASPEQAARVHANLARFEAPGGLLTSTRVSGSQWDAPFGWAPLQWIAVQGLRRYGFEADAARLSRRFLALVTKEFEEHGVIVEKYDVQRRESDVAADIRFGYSTNVVGFGWTNAVYVELLHALQGPKP